MSLKRIISIMLVLGLILPVFSASAQVEVGDLSGAVTWLISQQAKDGGFSNGFAPESDIGATADAILALVFAGEEPALITKGENSPLDFLEEQVQSGNLMGAGLAAKVILAINAVGTDPRSFGGENLITVLTKDFNADIGLFGMGPFDSALAIAALVAVDEKLPEGALAGLLATRLDDGSYSFAVDESLETGDSNTTALVVQALVAADAENEIGSSLAYFRATQNEDGGWTYQKPSEFGEDTDANSTALVAQALEAAGEKLSDWGDPLVTLAALQMDNGAFNFNLVFPGENILATIQAIPTLAGGTYANPVGAVETQANSVNTIVIGTSLLLVFILVGAFVSARMRTQD